MHGGRWRFLHRVNARVLGGSRTLERKIFAQWQGKSASHSSSIRRWPALPRISSPCADIKPLRNVLTLRRKAGTVGFTSDSKARGSWPSAYAFHSIAEPRQPDVSLSEETKLASGILEKVDNEPTMNGNLKDDVALGGNARVVRVKSGNRLGRQNVTVNGEADPLMSRQNSKSDSSEGTPGLSRRSTSKLPNGERKPPRGHSFKDDVGHAAAETFLLTRLTFSLLRYLGVGYRWMIKFAALALYAFFLMPGFVQVGYKYFFSRNIRRSIVCGDKPRNRLDLYTPENSEGPHPVVIFVTGGAWIIGYKAWGALLGMQLSKRGIMVCCTDYRNFPQGTISNMVEDVTTSIGFVLENIEHYGGDRERIYIAGQSAGCHLATCAIVEQARIEIGQTEGELLWSPSQFKGYLGLSGGYNLVELVDHFHKRGLYKRIFLRIMEGEESLPLFSPELAVRSEAFAPAVSLLPPIHLFHGTADKSIPYTASSKFGQALEEVGATAFVKLYPEKTHTDVFIQDPMRGGVDKLFEDFVAVINRDDQEARADDTIIARRRRLVPEFLLHLARAVSPF